MNNKICPLISTADKEVEYKKESCGFWFKDINSTVSGCSVPIATIALRAKR